MAGDQLDPMAHDHISNVVLGDGGGQPRGQDLQLAQLLGGRGQILGTS